jgi:hypothetical protein
MELIVLKDVIYQVEKFGIVILKHVYVRVDNHGMGHHVLLVPIEKPLILILKLVNVHFHQHGMVLLVLSVPEVDSTIL